MLFAHMDQLGFIVRKIEASGLIRIERLGGVPERALASQEVLICIAEGRDIRAVIANKSHHATSPEEKYRVLPYQEIMVDAGFSSADDALAAGVDIGSPIVYAPKAIALAGDRIAGTSVDDRAGCAVIVEDGATAGRPARSPDGPFRLLDPGGIQSARRPCRCPGARARHRHSARPDAGDRYARHAGARRRCARTRPGNEPLQLPWARHA